MNRFGWLRDRGEGVWCETGELAVGNMLGNKLYQQRARLALPIPVRLAKAGQTINYRGLAEHLGMPNHRNLNYVLGAIGNSMLDLDQHLGDKVPPIQAIVVNKATGLPGDGIAWFAPSVTQYKQASSRQRQRIVKAMLRGVFMYRGWANWHHSHLHPTPFRLLRRSLPTVALVKARHTRNSRKR